MIQRGEEELGRRKRKKPKTEEKGCPDGVHEWMYLLLGGKGIHGRCYSLSALIKERLRFSADGIGLLSRSRRGAIESDERVKAPIGESVGGRSSFAIARGMSKRPRWNFTRGPWISVDVGRVPLIPEGKEGGRKRKRR